MLAAGQNWSQRNSQEHRAICVTSFVPSSALLPPISVNKSLELRVSTALLLLLPVNKSLTLFDSKA